MRRSIHCFAVVSLVAASLHAQERRKTDNDVLPGEVWTFEANKGDLNRRGEFRIYEKKVFIGERNVGSVAVKGDEATLIVKAGGVLAGRILLKRDGQTSAWRGIVQHNDGSKWQITVSVKEDKPKGDKPKRDKKGDEPEEKKAK